MIFFSFFCGAPKKRSARSPMERNFYLCSVIVDDRLVVVAEGFPAMFVHQCSQCASNSKLEQMTDMKYEMYLEIREILNKKRSSAPMSQQPHDQVKETISDIEKAIQVNLSLQRDLQEKLILISKKKTRNRLRCLNLSRSLDKHIFESKVDLKLRERYDDCQKHAQRDWKIANEGKIKTRRFFIDPDKSVPQSNQDTIR